MDQEESENQNNPGSSKNAVHTQDWIALIIYFLLALLKFRAKPDLSGEQRLQLVLPEFI
jgi:hypothetical protein